LGSISLVTILEETEENNLKKRKMRVYSREVSDLNSIFFKMKTTYLHCKIRNPLENEKLQRSTRETAGD